MNISTSPNDNTFRRDVLSTMNRYINSIDRFNSNISIMLNTLDTNSQSNTNNTQNTQPYVRRNEPVQTRNVQRTSNATQNTGIRSPPIINNRQAAPAATGRRANHRQSTDYINNNLNIDYNSGDDVIQNWTFQIDLRDEEPQRGPLYNYFYNYLTRQFNELGDLQFVDVVVAPTRNEINNATRNIVFDSSASYVNMSCPISLEPFEHGQEICEIIHCGHLFHTSELQNWFRQNVRCPVCRYDIRTYRRRAPPSNESSEEDDTHDNTNNTNTTTPNEENISNTRLNLSNGRGRMSELFGNILQNLNTSTTRLNYITTPSINYVNNDDYPDSFI
jgi:hypothetical protein